MRIDYNAFRDINKNGDCYVETTSHRLETEPLASSETKTLEMGLVCGYKSPLSDSSRLVAGICCRIYLPLANGQNVMRELCWPENLSTTKYKWKENREKVVAPAKPSPSTVPQNWYSAYDLLKKGKLNISVKENQQTTSDRSAELPNLNLGEDWEEQERCNAVSYEIILNNRSGQPLKDIRVEYRIYHHAKINETVITRLSLFVG